MSKANRKLNKLCLCNSGDKYGECCIIFQQPFDRDIVAKRMENIKKKADELYEICLEEDPLKFQSVEPIVWLCNQSKMIESWTMFKNKFNNSPKFLKNIMLNNSFSNYMNFMCDNYPKGFGDKLRENYADENYDSAKLFYDLKRN